MAQIAMEVFLTNLKPTARKKVKVSDFLLFSKDRKKELTEEQKQMVLDAAKMRWMGVSGLAPDQAAAILQGEQIELEPEKVKALTPIVPPYSKLQDAPTPTEQQERAKRRRRKGK